MCTHRFYPGHILGLLVLLCCCCAGVAQAATGSTATAFQVNTPRELALSWSRDVSGWGLGAGAYAVGADGTIYLINDQRQLCAIGQDGTVKWAVTDDTGTESTGFTPPLLGPDGTVYAMTNGFYLYAFTPQGQQKWVVNKFSWQLIGAGLSAIGSDGSIYVMTLDETYHFDVFTPDGTLKRQILITGYDICGPGIRVRTCADGSIIVTVEHYEEYTASASICKIKPDGAIVFYHGELSSISDPVIAPDGTIYVRASDKGDNSDYSDYYILALNPDLTEKWQSTGFHYPVSVGADGTLYARAYDSSQHLYIIEALAPDGTPKWTFSQGTMGNATVTGTADGTVYIAKNKLYALNAAGELQWTFDPGVTQLTAPAIGPNGMLYVGADKLYALDAQGTVQATYNTGSTVGAPQLMADGMLYALSGSRLYAFREDALTTVSLTASPSAWTGTPISLTACANGVRPVEYKFRAGVCLGTGRWQWQDVQEYSTRNTCVWAPPQVGQYTLVVWAREVGHTGNYEAYAAIPVTIPPITAVTLSSTPAATQLINSPVTLHAAATGGCQVEYKFRAGVCLGTGKWQWQDLQEYSPSATCTWQTPAQPGQYTLVVYAREKGHTGSYDAYQAIPLTVSTPPITAVTLTTTPTAIQRVNTPVTLTAAVTGGAQVEYKFRVGVCLSTGSWQWQDLQGYSSSATCTWTPTQLGQYTLVVWAREVGHTANYDAYSTTPMTISTTCITEVTLSATPAETQSVNNYVVLAAAATSSSGSSFHPEYKFRVGKCLGTGLWQWQDLQDYSPVFACGWKPTEPGTYTLVVWVRDIGNQAPYERYATVNYTVTAQP